MRFGILRKSSMNGVLKLMILAQLINSGLVNCAEEIEIQQMFVSDVQDALGNIFLKEDSMSLNYSLSLFGAIQVICQNKQITCNQDLRLYKQFSNENKKCYCSSRLRCDIGNNRSMENDVCGLALREIALKNCIIVVVNEFFEL